METASSVVASREYEPSLANLTEIAIPIYNEEKVLAESVLRLRAHLQRNFPYPFIITIADNGSTDGSWEIASRLAAELPDVQALRVPIKGRGGAIRYAWARSQAKVVAYMDVDLSIDLEAFSPLIASVMSGHSDMAIGTRYAQGSYVERSLKRAFFSRSLNYILRNTMGARFSDAMCGFKAARRSVIQNLLPFVKDDRWFFDPELMLFAQRHGLRIHEVPVLCIDDPDSSVHVVRDAMDDLRAMTKVARRLVDGQRSPRFASIWALGVAVYVLLYLALGDVMPSLVANVLALVATVLLNTAALRKFSFGVRGAAGAIRYQLNVWLDFVARLVLTVPSLALLQLAWPDATLTVELTLIGIMVALSRYVRGLVFREREARPRVVVAEAP